MSIQQHADKVQLTDKVMVRYGTVLGTQAKEWGQVMIGLDGEITPKVGKQLLDIIAERLSGDHPEHIQQNAPMGIVSQERAEKLIIPAENDDKKREVSAHVKAVLEGIQQEVAVAGGIQPFIARNAKRESMSLHT